MTKSWGNARVDRGVNRRSRSRDRSRDRIVEAQRHHQGGGRTRNRSPSPARSNRDEVRKQNKGRELLDTRSFGRSSPSSSAKRRKSRSPSANRNQSKKSRRRDPTPPPRRRSPDREVSPSRARGRITSDRRPSSPSPRRDRRGRTPPRYPADLSQRGRSPNRSPNRFSNSRRSSPGRTSSKERRREYSEERGRRSPPVERYEHTARSRQSPIPKAPRDSTPPAKKKGKNRHNRDEYRPGKGSSVKSSRSAASGANSVEITMNHRGNYGGHPGFNQSNHQMQAAFPLNPQYNQQTQNYSQSPHVTPASSYHGSPPQAHSPYGAFQPPQHQQFSPHQYATFQTKNFF